MQFTLCKKKKLTELTGFSNSTFKRLRRSGKWTESIHYEPLNSRTILYVPELCLDYFRNWDDAAAHQRLIDEYLTWKEHRLSLKQ